MSTPELLAAAPSTPVPTGVEAPGASLPAGSGLPDTALITQLANQFFSALPGQQSAPSIGASPASAAGAPPVLSPAPASAAVPAGAPVAPIQPPTAQPVHQAAWSGENAYLGQPVPPYNPLNGLSAGALAFDGRTAAPDAAGPAAGQDYYFLHQSPARAASAPPPPPTSSHPPAPIANAEQAGQDAAVPPLSRSGLFPVALQHDPQLIPALPGVGRPFDPHAVRRDFPILQTRVHGRPLVWLDNAATTQKPQAVIDRLSYYYEHENSNIHRAAHTLAARSTDAYEAARDKVRGFLNAASVDEIIFVRGATEGLNLIAKSWGQRHIGKDDEIIVTWLEHHANIVPWQQLCAQTGAKLKVAPVDDDGQILLDEYERLFTSRTKLVSLTQVSNALGTITPAKAMVEIAHRHGARAIVDGAQSVSHLKADVQALGCDFFVFSGHKVFGPTGIGAVYGRQDVLEETPPWQGGGNMIADVTFERTLYQPPPARFEAGTGNIADAVGLGAAIDYVQAIGLDVIARYEHELLVYAIRSLSSVPGLRLIGTAADKAGVLSFVLDGHKTQDIGAALDKEGIAVRAGHHCAQPILRRFGVEATVRPSLALYNTCEDIDALTAALLRISAKR